MFYHPNFGKENPEKLLKFSRVRQENKGKERTGVKSRHLVSGFVCFASSTLCL